jgi:hypothetical protein
MNPGPIEEGGKIAVSVIDALKTQPLMLVLVIFNVLIFIFVYYGVTQSRDSLNQMFTEMRASDTKLLAQLVDQQVKTAEMLFRCSPNQH